MTNAEAIRIMDAHNKWRRGANYERAITPAQISEAIDVLLDLARDLERELDAAKKKDECK
jgi:hypothetical protein